MFEEYNLKIRLSVAEIYFIAKELGLEKIVGFAIDFEGLNKEAKVAIKTEVYEEFEKNKVLQMNFTGQTVVNNKYSEIVKVLENPELCRIINHIDNEKNTSDSRMIYKIENGIYYAFEEITEELYDVYKIPSELEDEFLFADININASDDTQNASVQNFETIDELNKSAKEIVVLSCFKKINNIYEFTQKMYMLSNENNWYAVNISDNDMLIIAEPVKENIDF